MSSLLVACNRKIEIFAASCSGCIALSRSIDLPLACVRVSVDAESAIEAMSQAAHAGAALWPGSFQPIEPQSGWRDWHILPFEADGGLPDGIRVARGRLLLALPAHVATAGFEAALHAELLRCRIDAATTSPAWLFARSDAGKPVLVLPRFTLTDEHDFRRGATRVDDLFVLDPNVHCGLIARLAQRAMARAIHIAEEAIGDAE